MFQRLVGPAIALALLAGCSEAGSGVFEPSAPTSVASNASTPERPATAWDSMSDASLWDYISARDSVVVFGYKKPGATRGIWRAHRLVGEQDLHAAERAIGSITGAQVIRQLLGLPALTVKVSSQTALSKIRLSPFADYVEPDAIEIVSLDSGSGSSGCTLVPTAAPKGTTFGGDALPPHYAREDVQVTNAWTRANGSNVILGLVDTGIHGGQSQLLDKFDDGYSSGRWYHYDGVGGFGWQESGCSHGTRMAGTMAAPMNGENVAGVAWKSPLISIHRDDNVWDGFGSGANTADAIYKAAALGPAPSNTKRVIAMAFRANSDSNAIQDQIRKWHDLNRLFIGASGSAGDGFGIAFPADMPEVIAVSVVNGDYSSRTGIINYGDEVELTFLYSNITHGYTPTSYNELNGTSGSTAAVSGIAALTWSQYPNETNEQIRTRLQKAGHNYPSRNREVGYGVPNAMKAVGGFYKADITRTLLEDHGYYQVWELSAAPRGGDGPYTYQWSHGYTGETFTMSYRYDEVPPTYSVVITDTGDGVSHSASAAFMALPPHGGECDPTQLICN